MTSHANRIGRLPKCPMSAYSASPPVMTRTTDPSTKNESEPCACMKCNACTGLTAVRIHGDAAISCRPSAAMVTNHTSMMGPNALPTRSVPSRCAKNSMARITSVIGTMNRATLGSAISSPSMAPSTDMAGVMMPSPYSNAMPHRASATNTLPLAPSRSSPRLGKMSASNAKPPPSPWLSARSTKLTYLTLITRVSAHTISERIPKTFSRVGVSPYIGLKHSLIEYNGLVPMSPYTTPRAVSVRTARRFPVGRCSAP